MNPIFDVVMTCKLGLSPVNLKFAPYLVRKTASTDCF